MLGTSATGKTCYMVAMCSMMGIATELNGFNLRSTDREEGRKLSQLWEGLLSTGEERWPPPNDEDPELYSFDLFYASRKLIVQFDWYDYRGGALQDYSIAPDVESLQDRIRETSCLMLCVSGEYLTEASISSTKKRPKLSTYKKLGVDSINEIISGSGLGKEDGLPPPPVVIIITKYDLCKGRPLKDILDNVKSLFTPFFAPGTKWLVMICPVTLGEELAEDLEEGEVEPLNVHIPVLFSLCADLLRQNWSLNFQRSNLEPKVFGQESEFLSRWIESKAEPITTEAESQQEKLDREMREIQNNLSLMLGRK